MMYSIRKTYIHRYPTAPLFFVSVVDLNIYPLCISFLWHCLSILRVVTHPRFLHPITSTLNKFTQLNMPRTKSTKGRDDFQPVDSMDPRVVQNMQDIAVFHTSNLEKNVQRQYNSKNKQWDLFCDHMNFSTGWATKSYPIFKSNVDSGWLSRRTVTPTNAAVYIYDWILRLPKDHSRK